MPYLRSNTLCHLRATLSVCFLAGSALWSQAPAVLSGHVTDSSGALVPGAVLALECQDAPSATTTSDSTGHYSFTLQRSGTCTLSAAAEGFAASRSAPFTLTPGKSRTLEVKLAVSDVQRVDVAPDTGDPTDPAANGDSTVLKGRAVDDLPMDTTEMEQQLNALAGGDTPELRVDGFTGGRMPPKSMIREIRINQNPYSAQNDTNPNSGYIEIFTRPGGNEFHGEVYAYGNDSAFNSISPLLTVAPPPYHSYGTYGEVNGPINKHMSFFLSGNQNGDTSNSIIKAQILDATGTVQVPFTQAVAASGSIIIYLQRII